MDEKIFSDDNSEIIVRSNNELGYSNFLDDDYWYYDLLDLDDWDYYDYDDDDWEYDDDYYYNSYNLYDYNDYYYYDYYPSYLYNNYLYNNYWYDNNYYWYDNDRYRRNRDDNRDDNRIVIDGDTLKVGKNYTENIWLNSAGGDYANVKIIDASRNSYDLFITGNSKNNTIISGNGQTTLWSGGGTNNTLKGGFARNYFMYTGGSKDVAVDFTLGDSERSDVIVFSGANYTSINRNGTYTTFEMANGNYLRVYPSGTQAENDTFLIATDSGENVRRYRIGYFSSNVLSYSKDVDTFYFNHPGQLVVNGSDNNIQLSGEGGQTFVNLDTINASESYGANTLSGNDKPNMIIGGSGSSTLWGGYGNVSDTLMGGTGAEVFRVGKFEGSDVIFTSDSYDVIYLYDTNLSDITFAKVEDVISAGFNSGNELTIYNYDSVTPIFQLKDGSRYNYNRATNQWQVLGNA